MLHRLIQSLFILLLIVGCAFKTSKENGEIIELTTNKSGNKVESIISIFQGNIESISKIIIQKETEAIEIYLNNNKWHISGEDELAVKTRSLDNLFEKVLKVRRSTIISDNPDKYAKYSIDDSSGIHLAIIDFNGETVGYYVFGRSKSDYSRSYVRIGDDPNVYLADQNVTYMLNTRETFWGERPKEEIPPPLPVDISADTTAIN